MKIEPYLTFDGNCREAFEMYAKTLGGKIEGIFTYGDTPGNQDQANKDRIMHARLTVGDAVILGSDAPPPYFSQPQGFSVSVDVDSPAEAERIFKALGEGGQINMPIEKTFWAERFGMLVDRFGTPWMVNCEGSQKAAAGTAVGTAADAH